jgi:FkbM family methyltransferase
MFLQRVRTVLSRRHRAGQLGFHFHRARDFALPRSIRISGKDVSICAPAQEGINCAFLDILLDDCYGLRVHSRRQISSVLDVGACVGFFALAARDAFPSAAIHAYEPNPAVLSYLSSHSQAAEFQVFPEAVGATEGKVDLVDHVDWVQARTMWQADGKIPQVAFRTAVERIGGHCDLVKLDCEGAEWEILTDVTTWRKVDHLTMEYHLWHGEHEHEEVAKVLGNIGFAIRRQLPTPERYGIVWASRK